MAEKMKTVEEYIAQLSPDQQAIVVQLRTIIKAAIPEAKESIKWAQPVYEVNGPMTYIKAFKNQVNFGFWRGTELSDPDKLLEGSGDKMKHVKVKTLSEINEPSFTDFLKQAAALNRKSGDPTKPQKSP